MGGNHKQPDIAKDWAEAAEVLPQALREARRWMLWKAMPTDGGKARKVPFYCSGKPRHGELDSPQDFQNLSVLADALAVLASERGNQYAGLAFALGPDGSGSYWQGIDLDALSQNTNLQVLASALPGYVERSPSGDGLHAIGYGKPFNTLGSNSTGIEAYSSKRFFTVTCDVVRSNAVECLAEFVEAKVAPMHSPSSLLKADNDDEYFSADEQRQDIEQPNANQIRELREALANIPSDDRHQWQRIGHALKTIEGDAGRELWLEWSAKSEKHNPVEDRKTWCSYKPTGIHWKAVFNVARAHAEAAPAWHQEPSGLSALRDFRFLTMSEILQVPSAPDWLIDGFLEHGSSSMLVGKRAAGKSFLALDWSLCVAHGIDWDGNETRQGSVLYIAGEGNSGLGRRVRAWREHHEIDYTSQAFMLSNRAADLYNSEAVSELIDVIDSVLGEHQKPALIIIDTLARNTGGANENDNSEMAVFMNNVSMLQHRYGAHVLTVHHCGNGNDKRARGASCLEASVDHVYMVEASADQYILRNTKMKDGPEHAALYFNLQDVHWLEQGVPVRSAVLQRDVPKVDCDNKAIALRALTEAMKDNPAGITREAWLAAFLESHAGDVKEDSKRRAFSRALDALIGTEVLCSAGLHSVPTSRVTS